MGVVVGEGLEAVKATGNRRVDRFRITPPLARKAASMQPLQDSSALSYRPTTILWTTAYPTLISQSLLERKYTKSSLVLVQCRVAMD